jgi:hypothetical protein
MQLVEKDIRDIKEGMLKHNSDDDKRFSEQDSKLTKIIDNQHEFRELQLINHEVLKSTEKQTIKTNGRVTHLEGVVTELVTSNKLLHQIVSVQHGQFLKFENAQEAFNTNKLVNKSEFVPVKILVFGFVGIILMAVIGALVATVLK